MNLKQRCNQELRIFRERERERESFYLFVWAKYGLNENRKFLEEAQVKE